MTASEGICRRAPFRCIAPLCAITAFALLSVLPIGAAAQVVRGSEITEGQ